VLTRVPNPAHQVLAVLSAVAMPLRLKAYLLLASIIRKPLNSRLVPLRRKRKTNSPIQCAQVMTVSIIIRTFNRAHSIAEAIQSALQQTYQDFELIVVDDASTDATSEVIRSFHDDRIRVFRHDSNRGVGAACNTGIRAAIGGLIAWLDSDDIWHPDKLALQVDFLHRNPDVVAVFSDVCIHDKDVDVPSLVHYMPAFQKILNPRTPVDELVVTQREMYLCLLQEVPIKPTALVIRRNIFEQVGLFDESARSGEDWEFLLRVARFASFGYINRPLAEMNWTPDSTYWRFWLNDKTFLVSVFKRERESLRQDIEAFKAARRGLLNHFKSLGYYYVENHEPRIAARTYLEGFQATRDAKMILQAGAAFIPIGLRKTVMRLVKGTPPVGRERAF
jgi:glycosyltransferase involved in cell wall biosynthesis